MSYTMVALKGMSKTGIQLSLDNATFYPHCAHVHAKAPM